MMMMNRKNNKLLTLKRQKIKRRSFELEEKETVAEKRKRLCDEFRENTRVALRREEEGDEFDEDSPLARRLQAQQLEDSGRRCRYIASRVQNPKTRQGGGGGFELVVKHRQSVTVAVLSEDDSIVFSASKDGSIRQSHLDHDHGGKTEETCYAQQGRAHVLALAVSSDGRQGTSELFSGSYDRTIKIWNAEDRSYVTTLFGHQSHVLSIDCLRKERLLTAARDRTMHLWKVPEESQLVFRAPASSLECCCFINNDEILSGSDDGSIEHWSVLRKKPLHIIKNAHSLSTPNTLDVKQNHDLSNNCKESLDHVPETVGPSACSWVSSVAVCRGSDLAASGAGNGVVRLWEIEKDAKGVQPLFELPLVGYVNSLAFAKSGKFLVAGVGKEHRLGRWGSLPAARNGVAVHPLQLS
ncbi:putative transcription factor WD40-like family [Helianthus annuus]|nr:putative transcription factor WD40-like family [Helianthus annuus]